MRQIGTLFFIVLFFFVSGTKGQVVVSNPTNTTPNLAATYTSLANAITALNGITSISGPVTITLSAGNPQTAPAGGYAIRFATVNNTAASPITITGSGNTITAFSPQASGQLYNGIFKLIGADYITIQNFVMQENAANTTTTAGTNNMTEWGVALQHKSTTDGAQNNTIQNNTISLNKNYQNSFGIYSSNRHSATVIGTTEDGTNNTTAPNSNNKVYGNNISNVNLGICFVGVPAAANMDVGNDIGGTSAVTGNSVTNWGGAPLGIAGYISQSQTIIGIFTNHQVSVNISYNVVTSATISGITTSVRGIHYRYSNGTPTGTFTSTISNNTVSLTNNNTSGNFNGILTEELSDASATVNITDNKIFNNSWTAVAFTGISNTSACGVMNISNNIFRGNTSSATATGFTAINQSAAVVTTVTINSNSIGDGSGNAITFSGATSGALNGINCSNAGTAASVSISNNNFQGFVQSLAGSGIHTYILLTHAPTTAITDNINTNTFTNLTANTTGNVRFIYRSGAMAQDAGATQNCNNNSIVTAFSKPAAGGIVSLYSTGSTCFTGNTFYETGNDFSNITLTGATDMAGWDNEEGTIAIDNKPAKNINTNIFKNWNCGSGTVNVIQFDFAGPGTYVTGNSIENISTSGGIEGIFYGTGSSGFIYMTDNTVSTLLAGGTAWGISGGSSTLMRIKYNDIHSITSTGAVSAIGIRIIVGSSAEIYYNKIYDINALNVSCVASGIDIASTSFGQTFDFFNNIIGDIKAPLTSNNLAVTGIKMSGGTGGNNRFYHNTIYLNASSSGTNFGSAALYVLAPGVNSTLRNSILVNTSVANGTGVTVAYRRSSTDLTTYNSASNKNVFYGGTPSPTNLIFYDGTNSDQTLAAYKTRVGPTKDANSFTELPPFLSVSGASVGFLHIDPTIPTQIESGCTPIVVTGDDFDGDPRDNPSDIGADEFDGIYSEVNPPVIGAYTTLTTPTCSFTNRTITGVNITDATGIPLIGVNVPRIYYRKNAGTWFSQPGTNTSGTATNSNWDFTIVTADMAPLSGGEVISYYIIAQDLNPIVNVGSSPSAGLVATGVNNVTTHPTSPNTYTYTYNLNGTYTVGVGGNFTTLTAAVTAYNNACSLTGPTIFELTDNSYTAETFPIIINNRVDASAAHTLTIRPNATAIPVITGASATQIFDLNGSKYIIFDGRQGGVGTGKSFTISNTNAAGVTIRFINDAQNNVVKYCSVKGMRASSIQGTIFFSTAGTGTGNDNNTIDNNDISDAGGQSNNGIASSGTAGKENENNIVSNNNIFNYFNATADSHGIYLSSNSSTWTITGNRLYQTATRVYTGPLNIIGIYLFGGSGYTVNNNVIGFANASGTGTTNMIGNSVPLAGFPSSYTASGSAVAIRYMGIGVSAAIGAATSNVDGNTIGGFAMYTASNASTNFGMFGGIYVESGTVNIGSNSGNIIGTISGNNSIYVATTTGGGTFVGIRSSSTITSLIQNNSIGSVMVSGTTNAVSGSFSGISIAGLCNYTVSNNQIGNADPDNIRIGYFLSSGALSNTGALTATNVGVTANFKAITSGSTGNALVFTNNTVRGWATSCRSTLITGIDASGTQAFSSASINVNNNFFGTAATNWINSTVDNDQFFYTINVTTTAATSYNIKDNDVRGAFFGTQSSVGGSFLRLTGATSSNAIATISGNTFTNQGFKFSAATFYFIFANYSISSTGQLVIDNNKIVGSFTASGACEYHMLHCDMTAVAGSKVDIINNDFSNVTAAAGFASNFSGLYNSFSGSSCLLTISNNKFSNFTFGAGFLVGFDISSTGGTTNCTGNTVSNISCQTYVAGISLDPGSSTGTFNVSNNNINNIVSTGSGGQIIGIAAFIPTGVNTTQTNITGNTINGLSTTNVNGDVSGIYLDNGHSSSTITITKNKIYDLTESATTGRVYGINNFTTLAGDITYSNNYIGDLRAPASNVTGAAVFGMRLYMVGGQAKVYYNTIHLSATAGGAQFSSAAVYADAATAVTLRNNIFSNVSFHGASGRTVAYWRGDTNLGTYDAASNNNLFYAGTVSAQNLIFYDGTNGDQILSTYQTRVTPKDNLSATGARNFISTAGSNINFLHIAPSANCSVNATGSNAGILLATDYDNEARSTAAPFITDIGADEFSKKNNWTGANGTNWNDAGNWSEGVVPNSDDDNVTISTPPVNQPVIGLGETYQVASVIIGTGGSLTNRGTLKVAGAVFTATTASFNNIQVGVVEGSVEMNGNCAAAQTLAGNVFVSNIVKNFTVTNDVKISSVTGEQLAISGALEFGAVSNKVLTTGNNVTLLSTENGTANVAKIINGNSISGSASVERYINTGTGGGQHPKSWQFLATPAKGQTILQSWQEGGATPAGYGTIITGTGTGFDITTAQGSMKFFDLAAGPNGNWTAITNTGNLIEDPRGYMVFVRGDRTVTSAIAAANQTILRIKGTLYQPNDPPPVSNVLPGKFASVGNPYASAIDINYMKNNGLFVNLDNDVIVWDPLLMGTFNYGGYQTLSAANNYEPTAGGTSIYPAGISSPFIQSGQAFFVHSSGPAGSVSFNESCKDGNNRLVNRPGIPALGRQFFRVTLVTPAGIIADGNAVAFDLNFSNNINKDDAYKLVNSGENFGLARNGKTLAVEARNLLTTNDTIFYYMSNLKKQAYQLRFAPKNIQATGLRALLIDRYLHTTTPLSLTDSSFINITISNDSLSYACDRFYVVFKQRNTINDHETPILIVRPVSKALARGEKNAGSAISIYPNPVEHKMMKLHFTHQPYGTYHIELLNKLGQPVYTTNVEINNPDVTRSITIPASTAYGIYQVNVYSTNGSRNSFEVLIK